MTTELEALKDVASRLHQANVDYMLTGSFAKIFYSTPRMTRDIDIVINLTKQNSSSIIKAFSPDYYIDPVSVERAIQDQRMFNIIHNKQFVKIDFVIRKSTPFRDLEFNRRKKVKLADFEVWLVSPEDLIISKLDWARDSHWELQLGDVADLLEIKPLVKEYIQQWVQQLQIEEVYSLAQKKLSEKK